MKLFFQNLSNLHQNLIKFSIKPKIVTFSNIIGQKIEFLDQDRAKIWNFSTRIYRVLAFYTNMRDSRGLLLIFLQFLPKRAPKIGILTKTVAFYLIFLMCWICCLVSSYIWDDILFKLHLKFFNIIYKDQKIPNEKFAFRPRSSFPS